MCFMKTLSVSVSIDVALEATRLLSLAKLMCSILFQLKLNGMFLVFLLRSSLEASAMLTRIIRIIAKAAQTNPFQKPSGTMKNKQAKPMIKKFCATLSL